MSLKKLNQVHYAWWVLIGCCALQGSSLGLIYNCAGLFYAPVCESLGFKMGQFTLYRVLFSVSSALVLPAVAYCLRLFDVRVTISAAAVVHGLCTVGMGAFSRLDQWYLAGIVQGAASAFLCFLPAPILLANWFKEKTGTAIGISAAFSGLVGMIGSTCLGTAIPAFGWRACYVFVGFLSILLILPFSVFVLRYDPSRKGMAAYGETRGAEEVLKDAREEAARPGGLKLFLRQPIFYGSLLIYTVTMASSGLNPFLTACGLAAGMTMALAAMMTTLSLLGNMTSKLILGRASDRFGVNRTFLVSMAIACAGHLLLLTGATAGVMSGSLLYGIALPITSVMLPLFCRQFWKGSTYGTAYSYISMIGTLAAAPANSLFGKFYDMTGSYAATILVSCGLMAAAFVMVAVVMGRTRRPAAGSGYSG